MEAHDDFDAGIGTDGTITVDSSTKGRIEFSGDRDWFAVEFEAGRTYQVDLKGAWTGTDTLENPYLRGVHDANGTRIAGTTNDNGGPGPDSRITFTASETARHYIAAGAYQTKQGSYTLEVTDLTAEDDFAHGTDTKGVIAVDGAPATGEIAFEGDRDWFAVVLEAGKTYEIDLKGAVTGNGTLRNPELYGIHDANGAEIADTADTDGGEHGNSLVTFSPDTEGTYYVAVGGEGDNEGTYEVSVTDVSDTDDFGEGTATQGTVRSGQSVWGEIEFEGDQDWFSIELEVGQSYRIDVKGHWTGNGTLRDPSLLGVHDPTGTLIDGTTDEDSGWGEESLVTFTAHVGDTHYVAIGGNGEDTGTYKLSVSRYGDDFAAGVGTDGSIEVNGSRTGNVNVWGDRDWFAVDVEAGVTYRVDLKGWWTSHGTLKDPYLYGVHDDNGMLIADTSDDDGGTRRNSQTTFTAQETDIYYVVAGAYDSLRGTYTVSVEEIM